MSRSVEQSVLKYAIAFSQRHSRKNKNAFCNEIGNELQSLGYEVRGVIGKKKGTKAMNLLIGDVKNAKTIILANYDTPQHNFGNPIRYFPMAGPASFVSSFLPTYTPMIICGGLSLWILLTLLPRVNFRENIWLSLVIVLVFMLIAITNYVMTMGTANKVNFNRNTSGVVALLEIAAALPENKRKDVAFVLTDNGTSNHAGDYMMHEALPKTIQDRLVIMLDCVGAGDMLAVGYREKSKDEAKKMAACFEPAAKTKLCTKDKLKYTSFSFYEKGILICRGKDVNSELVVENTGSKHDIECEFAHIESCVQAVVNFLVK